MAQRYVLVLMLALLGYGLWASPDFLEIAAGVSIFLFGMLGMEQGFRALAGGLLERVLRGCTDRTWKSVLFGMFTTSVVQSSSLVSVIAISFLGAGMISLTAGVGIILGANLGTTTGAWLIAGFGLKVSLSTFALPLLVFGVVLAMQRSRVLRGLGYVLAGLGFLFLGIHHMKEGFEAFRSQVDLRSYAMPGLAGLLVYVAVGVAATVIMQSSHATLVLTITALATGQLSYENALALAIGSNVGTTVTAVLGALGASIDGRRLAAAHVLFNLLTGALAIVFIDQLVSAVDRLADGVGIGAQDYALRLAVFHSVFNLAGLLLTLPFLGALVRVVERLLPAPVVTQAQPYYLNPAVVGMPGAAVQAVRRETLHVLSNAFEILAHGIGLHRRDLASQASLEELVSRRSRPPEINIDSRYNRTVKPLFGAIVEFTSQVQVEGDSADQEGLFRLRDCARQIVDAVKGVKHLNKNLSRHMHSSNDVVRAQYDTIRIELGEVLRQVAQLGDGSDVTDSLAVLAYDNLKLRVAELDAEILRTLTAAVRQQLIPAATVTSIINDAHYAKTVGVGLIDVMQTLTSMADRDAGTLLEEVSLEPTEMRELHEATSMDGVR